MQRQPFDSIGIVLAVVACLLAAIVLGPVGSAAAEVPNRPPEWLRERATHVVVCNVVAIYQREAREGLWKVTHYVAEVHVNAVEKGDGLAADSIVYARYLRRSYRGPGRVADTAGHRGLAKEGEDLRLYLAHKASDGFRDNSDGGYNVLFPNGFERLPEDKPEG